MLSLVASGSAGAEAACCGPRVRTTSRGLRQPKRTREYDCTLTSSYPRISHEGGTSRRLAFTNFPVHGVVAGARYYSQSWWISRSFSRGVRSVCSACSSSIPKIQDFPASLIPWNRPALSGFDQVLCTNNTLQVHQTGRSLRTRTRASTMASGPLHFSQSFPTGSPLQAVTDFLSMGSLPLLPFSSSQVPFCPLWLPLSS